LLLTQIKRIRPAALHSRVMATPDNRPSAQNLPELRDYHGDDQIVADE
jgi:hypothetical protein